MVVKISEDYYSFEKYEEISGNYCFDIWWVETFLTISHHQQILALAINKKKA